MEIVRESCKGIERELRRVGLREKTIFNEGNARIIEEKGEQAEKKEKTKRERAREIREKFRGRRYNFKREKER